MSFSELYPQKVPAPQDTDQSTLSNYKDIRTTHTDLEWEIDWDRKVFGGKAVVSLEATADKVDEVILDTSFLDVKSVEIGGKAAVSLEWARRRMRANIE